MKASRKVLYESRSRGAIFHARRELYKASRELQLRISLQSSCWVWKCRLGVQVQVQPFFAERHCSKRDSVQRTRQRARE